MFRKAGRILKRSTAAGCLLTPFCFKYRMNRNARFFSLRDIASDQKLLRVSEFGSQGGSENRYGLKTRDLHIQEVTADSQYDVLIVGGGASGAGSVLSASVCGLKSLIIDAYDYGSATSSKSSKLIHGGVRYFQTLFSLDPRAKRKESYNLVKHSSDERERMINNIPHLTRYLPTVIPCTNFFKMLYYYMGMKVYTAMCEIDPRHMFTCPKPYVLGENELRANFPLMNKKYKWGVVYFDGEMDDSRVCLETILTSSIDGYIKGFKGANCLNYTVLKEILKDKEGLIRGAIITDKVSGNDIEVKCKAIINATGSHADVIRRMDDPLAKRRMVHSRGTHIALDRSFCPRKYGILLPHTKNGRVLFVLPWLHSTIVGTTDDMVQDEVHHPFPEKRDVEQILGDLGEIYPELQEKNAEDYILSNWSGLRPLVLNDEAQNDPRILSPSGELKSSIKTSALSREHLIEPFPSGLISVMGGKWTIYREMGEDAVSSVLDHFEEHNLMEKERIQKMRQKSTKYLRLIGDYRMKDDPNNYTEKTEFSLYHKTLVQRLEKKYSNVDLLTLNHLARKYGVRSYDILNIMKRDESTQALLHEEYNLRKAEILYFLRCEQAVSPLDIILRRSRIGFFDSESAQELIPHIIDIMGDHHEWDVEKKKVEYEHTMELFKQLRYLNITSGDLEGMEDQNRSPEKEE